MSTYNVELITLKDHQWRGIAFLASSDGRLTAKASFNEIIKNETDKKYLMTSFDWWLSGKIKNERFHGWNKSEFGGKYTGCFTFKIKRTHVRFYGFLCNPKKSNPRYQACILVSDTTKFKHETDEIHLKRAEELRNNLLVRRAIDEYFK